MSKHIQKIQALSLGLVLAVAFGIGCSFFAMACYELYDDYLNHRSATRFITLQHEFFRVLSDGRPLIEIMEYHPRRKTYHLDLNRRPVQLPKELEWLEGASLWKKKKYFSFLYSSDTGSIARPWIAAHNLNRTEDWYFVFDDKPGGLAYFVGFDLRDRNRIGFLGKEGFRTDKLPREEQFIVNGGNMVRFPGTYLLGSDGRLILQSEYKLFHVNLKTRTVQSLLGETDVFSIAGVKNPETNRSEGQSNQESLIAVATSDKVLVLDHSGEIRQTYHLPFDFPERGLEFHLLPDGNALLIARTGNSRDAGPAYSEYDIDLLWVTPQGAVTKKERITLRARRNIQHLSERAESIVDTMAVPAPLAGGVMALLVSPWVESEIHDKPYAEAVSISFNKTWPALLSLLVLSSILTYLADRRQRGYGLPRSYAWLVFVFLLGLPGYIAWLVHRPWPLRRTPPPPERTGLEIFAPP